MGLLVLLGLGGEVAREAVVALALPTGKIAVQLAQSYDRFVPESAAVLVLTTVAIAGVLPLSVVLTGFLGGRRAKRPWLLSIRCWPTNP